MTIREFETQVNLLFNQDLVRGAVHSSAGQEAVAVGVAGQLDNRDYLASTHRGHGHAIAKGASIHGLMAELMGRSTGVCSGKGGSMHVTDASVGLLGANGIVGASIELGIGAALTCQVKAEGHIAVAMFGEGAVAQGSFHEGMNLAALWKLPIVFVCENNNYAVSLHVKDSIAAPHVVDFAAPYGIPSARVDGMDLTAVEKAFAEGADRARSGRGPTLIEADTYRFMGHSRGDPAFGTYRSKEEHQSWKNRDPISAYANARSIGDETVAGLEVEARHNVQDAIDAALESPMPVPSDAYRHLFWER
nr:thiamine pyrophosphate-dependent dehydrogenase E1 component subunit alpha [Cryobacterium sp. Y50]